MMKNIWKVKVIVPILFGIIIGTTLFILGDSDDAPGLSFIGLMIAFLLTMRGIYHTKLVPNGYLIPIILFVFGVIALIFPVILFLDGEIDGFPLLILIGLILGIILITIASIKLKKAKHHSNIISEG